MWKLEEADYRKRVLAPACVSFAQDGTTPDLFTLYELPLDVSDEKDIQQALQSVVLLWNRVKQEPKYSKLISVLLQEHPDHVRTLKDARTRAEARRLAEAERRARSEASFKELDASIAIVAAKGYVTPEEIATLVARWGDKGLTEREVRDRIRVPQQAAGPQLPSDEGLPKHVRNEIRSNLNVLRQRSLYEFLGLPANVVPGKSEIRRAYDATTQDWLPKPKDLRKTAADILLGLVKVHLVEGDPARYELAKRWELVEALRSEVELAASDKRISREEFEVLLRRAAELGIAEKEAADIIIALAQDPKIGAAVEFTAAGEGQRCGTCFAVLRDAKNREKCPVCGQPLWTRCPRCAATCPSTASSCGSCRLAFADAPRVALHVLLGRAALEEGRLEDAARHASDAQRLWGPGGDPAALQAAVAERAAAIEQLRQEHDSLVASRRLFAARATLARLESEAAGVTFRDGRNAASLRAALDVQAAKLEASLARARAHENSGQAREAILAFQESLEIAADSPDAAQGLRRHRPEPSPQLRVETRGQEVELAWGASPAVGTLNYVLVAREGAPATTPDDGRIVGRSGALGSRDASAPAGVPLYYAVFVERGGAHSAPAVAGPVLVTPEVSGLALEVGDRQVHGKWSFPPSGQRARVVRKANSAPAGPRDGDEIASAGANGFLDRDVENDAVYYYRVSVEYQDGAGHAVLSPGLVASARPTAPPPAVQSLQVAQQPDGLRLTWDPPARGEVAVFRAAAVPDVRPGEAIPTARASSLGTRLPSGGPGAARDAQPASGAVYYVPVTIVGDLATPGSWRRYMAIPDVTGLRGHDFGQYLQIQWQWPDDCPLAVVAWRHDRPPTDVDDPAASRRKVSRGEYEHQGGVRLERPPAEPHHIVVYAARLSGAETAFAPGIGPGAQLVLRATPKVAVSYEIRRSWTGALSVAFSADGEVESLPEVAIVATAGTVQPRRIEDGRVVAVIASLSVGPRSGAPKPVPLDGLRKPCCLRAFFRDPLSYTRFQLTDPSPSQLQVR